MKKNKRFKEGLKMGLQKKDIEIIEAIENFDESDFKELSSSLLRGEDFTINEILKEVLTDET